MTGKGLLACIDLAWIGLALASLVWFEAQPGIGGQVGRQSELLSSCVLALGPGLAWPGLQYEVPAGLHSSVFCPQIFSVGEILFYFFHYFYSLFLIMI